jgi:predicted NBD/HSP70 family sugar kinase
MQWIGIDIGGTTLKYGLVDQAGRVSQKRQVPTPKTHELLLEQLTQIIMDFQKLQVIQGVGISAPGVIQADGTMMTAGALSDSYGRNLISDLQINIDLPIYVENDANAATIAEQWLGNAQGKKNYLFLVLGTGVGGGIVINEQVFRGAHGMAGEFGWMMIDQLPQVGNLETASVNEKASVIGGICEKYTQATTQTITDARIVFEKAESGDQIAQRVLGDFYRNLSVTLLNLISCFDPEIVIIGGAISANQKFMKDLQVEIRKVAEKHEAIKAALKHFDVPLVAAKLQNDAGLIGAVYQVKSKIEKDLKSKV